MHRPKSHEKICGTIAPCVFSVEYGVKASKNLISDFSVRKRGIGLVRSEEKFNCGGC